MKIPNFVAGGSMSSTLNGSIRRGLAMVVALQALAVDAQGLEPEAAAPALTHPRICLVLSGGGARGAAHVGVLKVLEELRVPVHCIAGTSMGAIVGASYASGMSTQDMLAEMAQITSERLFTDKPPRADQPMRVKADDSLPLAAPELGLNNGTLTMPKGLVSGVALEGELRRLVRVRDARRFDQLPIPFRAVATSLGDGQMVILDRGLLSTAMRASMAVPGLIAPLKAGERLLIDGGLVRNLPVDVARAMGADVIIAVNLGTPLLRPEQIEGLQGVSMQTLGILTEQNVRLSLQQLRPQDVLIEPALGDFSAADFDHLVKAVPFGEAAALQAAPRLQALALPAAEFAQLRQSRLTGETPALPVIASVDDCRPAARQCRVGRAVDADAGRPAAGPGRGRSGHAAHLRQRRLRKRAARTAGRRWRADAGRQRHGEGLGAAVPAPGPVAVVRPGSGRAVQLLRPVALDLAQQLGRRVAKRCRAG